MHITVLDPGEPRTGETLAASSMSNVHARIVLTMLALEAPRLVRSDELAEVLWPVRPPKTWATMVRGAVAKVRRWIEHAGLDPLTAVRSGDGGYRLELPAGWSIDVHDARRALAEAERAVTAGDAVGAAAAADRAVAIIVGRELLAEHDGDWLREARRGLQVLATDAIQIGAVAALDLGNHRRAVTLARQLIALEPFGEPGYHVLMRALAAGGDRARALQVYDELTLLLRLELGVSPSIETQSVHRGLRDASPVAVTRDPLDRAQLADAGMIGRVAERSQLVAAWDRARAGRLTVALVTGEAGIGKTTLVLHAAHDAWTQGAPVLFGRCSPDAAIAYEPMIEAITAHAESCDGEQRRRLLAAAGPAVGWLVPSLTHLLDVLAPSSDPDRDRLRLFEAVTAYIGAVSAEAPTVLLLDDVQWARSTTWSLLDHLVRRLRTAPLLVVMTERRPEIADPRLAEIVASWRRTPGISEIALEGWSRDEAAAYVASATDRAGNTAADPTLLADSLRIRTGGNPYFISELLRARPAAAITAGTSMAVPPGIVEIVDHHLAVSGAETTALMQALAVIGADAGSQLLRLTSELGPDAFLDALDAALATGLVGELPDRPGSFRFVHALARDAVYAGVPRGHRLRLHGRVGEALEQLRDRGAAVSPSALAHHFSLADGLVERAVGHILDASRADLATGARDEAATQLRRALELDPPERLRCDVLLLLGKTLAQQGDGSESATAYFEAAELARRLDDGRSLAQAAIGLTTPGRGVTTWVADPALVELLRAALTALGTSEDALRIRLLGALSDAIVDPGSWEQRQRLAEDAVTIASRSHDPRAITAALAATRIAWWRAEQTESRLAATDRVLEIATSLGDIETAASAALARVGDLIVIGQRGPVDDALVQARQAVERADMLRYDWALRLIEAGLALSDGRFVDAEAAALDAFAMWRSDDQPDARRAFEEQVGIGMLAADDTARIAEHLEAFLDAASRATAYRCAEPYVLILLDRQDAALAAIEVIAEEGYRVVPAHSSWLFAMAALADAASIVGPESVVRRLRSELSAHAGRMVHLEGPSITWGSVDHRLGTLAFATGDHGEAERHLRDALEQHSAFGARPWRRRTAVALAEVIRARGGPAAGEEAGSLLLDGQA